MSDPDDNEPTNVPKPLRARGVIPEPPEGEEPDDFEPTSIASERTKNAAKQVLAETARTAQLPNPESKTSQLMKPEAAIPPPGGYAHVGATSEVSLNVVESQAPVVAGARPKPAQVHTSELLSPATLAEQGLDSDVFEPVADEPTLAPAGSEPVDRRRHVSLDDMPDDDGGAPWPGTEDSELAREEALVEKEPSSVEEAAEEASVAEESSANEEAGVREEARVREATRDEEESGESERLAAAEDEGVKPAGSLSAGAKSRAPVPDASPADPDEPSPRDHADFVASSSGGGAVEESEQARSPLFPRATVLAVLGGASAGFGVLAVCVIGILFGPPAIVAGLPSVWLARSTMARVEEEGADAVTRGRLRLALRLGLTGAGLGAVGLLITATYWALEL